jgi:hypothetical protein
MAPTNKEEELSMQTTPNQETDGCLMFLTSTTQPHIAFATNQVARFSHNPGPAYWEGVKRIISYLSGTRNYGLCFSGSSSSSITGFTDADNAGDVETRSSITGYVFLLHEGPVARCCKRQKSPSLSTT